MLFFLVADVSLKGKVIGEESDRKREKKTVGKEKREKAKDGFSVRGRQRRGCMYRRNSKYPER
jgi:hypothetical protein